MGISRSRFVLGTLAAVGAVGVITWAALTVGANRSASLRLETRPAGASAYVNGNFMGVTPLDARELPAANCVLRVTKFGCVPLLREIDLRPGANEFKYDLAPLPGGTLEIVSTPSGADVFMDGEPRGQTPLTLKSVGAGGHTVRLSLVNYLDWSGTVDVEQDKSLNVTITLGARMEKLLLQAIQANPRSIVNYSELAHYYVLSGEWKKAEDTLTNALAVSADSGDSGQLRQEIEKIFMAARGDGQFTYDDPRRGQEAVVNAVVRAAELCPRQLEYYGLAIRYSVESGMAEKALHVVETGILTFDQDWVNRALHGTGKPGHRNEADIFSILDDNIGRNPKDFVSRFYRAVLLRQMSRPDELAAEYEQLVKLAPSVPVKAKMLTELGRTWERKRDFAKAAESYRQAVQAETARKAKAVAQSNLSRVLGRLDRADEAVAAWKEAVALQEDVERACDWRLQLVDLCIKTGKKDVARDTLNEVITLSRNETTLNRAKELLRGLENQ
jgi:tetratricopeptide (TPR) repeat protein